MIDRHSSARRCARICSAIGIAGVLLAALLPGSGTARAADQMRLLETGSSLLYPLFNLWVPAYSSSHPDVQITTQSTGSGTGISEAISGIAQVGASDAYMSNPQMHANRSMLNIPLAISSQMVNYNPGVNLPHQSIVPIHRTDGSGDTFIFTQYLAFSTPSWNQSIAYGTTVAWPAVSGGLGAEGNPGMVNASKTTPYSIAYIGISFKKATDAAGLGEAALQNRAGEFVLPTAATVQAAVRATAARTPADERISLIFAPGAQSYPIINYEYAIVNSRQPSRAQGTAVRQLLDWCINPRDGNAAHFMDAVGFVALPEAIAQLSRKQIAMIH